MITYSSATHTQDIRILISAFTCCQVVTDHCVASSLCVEFVVDEISPEELLDVFTEQASALAFGGADGIVIETMSDLAEASLAVEAAKSTGLPVVACMCYDSGAGLDRTMMGVTPEQAAQKLEAIGADVIGANCSQGIEGYVAIGRRLVQSSRLPVWIKANAGMPKLVNTEVVYEITPKQFAELAGELVDVGVSFLGGCCGTSPQFMHYATNWSKFGWKICDDFAKRLEIECRS